MILANFRPTKRNSGLVGEDANAGDVDEKEVEDEGDGDDEGHIQQC